MIQSPFALIAFALVGLIGGLALGAPPEGADPNSPMASWYRSLETPDGGSCCSEADCRPATARLADDHWEIRLGEGWEPVPPERVLKRENADGRPIACIFGGRILCFVPPAGA